MKRITAGHLATWAAYSALALLANCLPETIELEHGAAGVGGEDGSSDAAPSTGTDGTNDSVAAGGSPAMSSGATTGNSESATGGTLPVDAPSNSDAGSDTSPPSGPCPAASLDVPWPVISGCVASDADGVLGPTAPRCPFPSQLNVPDYGPFVACCPPSAPYACPTGTPQSCFATAEEAAADCGDACVTCTDPTPRRVSPR